MLEKELWKLFWRRQYVDIDSIVKNALHSIPAFVVEEGEEDAFDNATKNQAEPKSLMRATTSRIASVKKKNEGIVALL